MRWPREEPPADHGQQLFEIEQLLEAAQRLLVAHLRDAVDLVQQHQRLAHRDVPPQLRALAEDDADRARVLNPLPVRDDAVDTHFARARHQDAGQQLDRRRLAGPDRPHVGQGLAGLDRQVDVVHRDAVGEAPREEVLERAREARVLERRAEDLGPLVCLDQSHCPVPGGSGEDEHAFYRTARASTVLSLRP
jgi:hypothetical protein